MLPAQLSKRLDSISYVSRDGKRVNGLYRLLGHPELWMEAYANIHSNKGAITKGIDSLTLDGFSDERVINHIQLIKDGLYKPTPVRRTNIPKGNGKTRPLGIPSGNDKLTQEVFRMILSRIYEPVFHIHSHGFRKKHSCHTALKSIQDVWTGVKWIVSIDIKGFFDNMDHSIMIQILEKRIDDCKFINMIKDMLKAGYLENWKYHPTYSGTPQGGIVSPILSNIYLHELDMFVSRLSQEFETGKRRKHDLRYKGLSSKILARYKKVDLLKSQGNTAEANGIIEEIKSLKEERSKYPSSDPFDKGYRKLRYCRYADDFILGIIGSKEDAYSLKTRIEIFLNSELALDISTEKSHVKKATDGVTYLGYGIRTFHHPRKTLGKRGNRRVIRKAGSDRLQFYIPREKIVNFCKSHGYGDYVEMKSMHRSGLIFRDDAEIAMIYNSEMRGFSNYYKLVGDFKTELGKLHLIWMGSFLRTLAAKHKSTVRKMQNHLRTADHYTVKYSIQGEARSVKLFKLKDIQVAQNEDPDEMISTLKFSSPRTTILERLEASKCEYCQKESGYFEVHHVNKLKNLSNKTPWEEKMIAIRRKTIVLCIDCHQELHRGTLPDYRHLIKK